MVKDSNHFKTFSWLKLGHYNDFQLGLQMASSISSK